jgi:hypothetical protein
VSNTTVRSSLKIATISFLVLLGVVVVHGMFSPYTSWYFVVPNARLTVDGRKVKGWLHRGNHRETLFLTRRENGKAESYLIWAPRDRKGMVWNCGDWTAPRFPTFPIGDLNPPCSIFSASNAPASKSSLPARDLVVGTSFVEFAADDGSRIKVSW